MLIKLININIFNNVEYVGRNYDLFLKHIQDIDDSFTDRDLEDALIKRNEFKL